ncbi:MAG: NAD-dependent epimerase/dehydratase family protein [Proteobacteria bacterium]|nr:NAD-dependent epimerase/dehydratase family protein [Pseudomonadota bacterium]
MKRVLVTGAGGFVGKSLIPSLLNDRFLIIATNRSTNELSRSNNSSDLQYVFFDMENVNTDYDSLLNSIDTVIHLAGRVHFDDSNNKDANKKYYNTNVLGTKLLAKAASKNNVRRFIYLSTVKVNGENNLINSNNKHIMFNEDDVPDPKDHCAAGKLDAELELREICKSSQMEFVILRPTLIYGPGVKADFLSLLNFIMNRNLPLPLALVKTKRSFIYIGNLVNAITMCIDSPIVGNKLYLLSDIDISVPALIKEIARYSEKTFLFPFPVRLLKLIGIILAKDQLVNRLTDSLIVNNSKFVADLDWKPPCTFEDGIKETVNWCKKECAGYT